MSSTLVLALYCVDRCLPGGHDDRHHRFPVLVGGRPPPVLFAVSNAIRFLRVDRYIWFTSIAVTIGFLAGGVIGWVSVPATWTASIWTTIDAAGNSAKYGGAVEHTAERVLMWFFYSASWRLALGVVALLVTWRLGQARSARVSLS